MQDSGEKENGVETPPTVDKACSVESFVDDSKLNLIFQSKDADLALETMCEDLKTVAVVGFVQTVSL